MKAGIKMRLLSDTFMDALKSGKLQRLLETVLQDGTLDLQIRENCINVYYRGGSLLKVTEEDGQFKVFFDMEYCIENYGLWTTFNTKAFCTINDYVDNIPLLKREMDHWFMSHQWSEREAQQYIVYENNRSVIARDTDYFIADIEYAGEGFRFDMIAVKWPSSNHARRSGENLSLAFVEVKYGDGAIDGDTGIGKHSKDVGDFCSDTKRYQAFCSEMNEVIRQKTELGLLSQISSKHANGTPATVKIDHTIPAELIIVLINHKPAKSAVTSALQNNCFVNLPVRIAKASNMGYGLYLNHIVDIDKLPSALT
jgi:hypothetical protein